MLAFGLYLVLAAFMDVTTSPAFDLRKDPAYQLAEKLYPVLTLAVSRWS